MSWQDKRRYGEDPLVTITRMIQADLRKLSEERQKMAAKMHPPLKKPDEVSYAPIPVGKTEKKRKQSPLDAAGLVRVGDEVVCLKTGERSPWIDIPPPPSTYDARKALSFWRLMVLRIRYSRPWRDAMWFAFGGVVGMILAVVLFR